MNGLESNNVFSHKIKLNQPLKKEQILLPYSSDLFSEEIKLYQPLQNKQILLPDLANCSSVQAFLRMCKLNYDVIYKHNAEDMSPSGELPFMKCNIFLVSGFETIVNFFEQRGVSLSKNLEESKKIELQAYSSLVNMVLANAENYIIWKDQETYENYTNCRISSVYPWPLSWCLCRNKKNKAIRKLDALDWFNKDLEEVYAEVDMCCKVLSNRLNGGYFGDQTPTALDAMVYGHVHAILASPLPKNHFADIIRDHPELITHCKKVEYEYFN